MIDTLLSFIAPHHCYGCGKSGLPLCHNCKYNIISEPYGRCIVCQKPANTQNSLCGLCRVPYQRAWCVGERSDELQKLIGAFKFQNVKAAAKPLGELLNEILPQLPESTVIIPIPTVAKHIRQRAYDHTLLIARHLAKRRKLSVSTDLKRLTNTKQLGASRKDRLRQAKVAFACRPINNAEIPYLLIDDVVTTGATLEYATKALIDAGAKTVWVATVSRQSLQKLKTS